MYVYGSFQESTSASPPLTYDAWASYKLQTQAGVFLLCVFVLFFVFFFSFLFSLFFSFFSFSFLFLTGQHTMNTTPRHGLDSSLLTSDRVGDSNCTISSSLPSERRLLWMRHLSSSLMSGVRRPVCRDSTVARSRAASLRQLSSWRKSSGESSGGGGGGTALVAAATWTSSSILIG